MKITLVFLIWIFHTFWNIIIHNTDTILTFKLLPNTLKHRLGRLMYEVGKENFSFTGKPSNFATSYGEKYLRCNVFSKFILSSSMTSFEISWKTSSRFPDCCKIEPTKNRIKITKNKTMNYFYHLCLWHIFHKIW